MTVCIESYKGNGNYCTIEVTNNVYVVSVCPLLNDSCAGYPFREMTYPITEKKKAIATYQRYIRNYCTEGIKK